MTAGKREIQRHCHQGNNKKRKMEDGTAVIDSACRRTQSFVRKHCSFYFHNYFDCSRNHVLTGLFQRVLEGFSFYCKKHSSNLKPLAFKHYSEKQFQLVFEVMAETRRLYFCNFLYYKL